jgi:hypothetical protein
VEETCGGCYFDTVYIAEISDQALLARKKAMVQHPQLTPFTESILLDSSGFGSNPSPKPHLHQPHVLRRKELLSPF